MKVVSLETGDSREEGIITVTFSDDSSLVFSVNYADEKILPKEKPDAQSWETGRELTSGEEEAFRFAAACYRAEKTALRLIARAEQSSLTLTAKLEHRGFGAAASRAVVSRLLDRDLLDDGRFAELWIRSRLSSGKAVTPQWLLASLGKRGVDRNSSRRALEKTLDPETEYTLLLRCVDKITLKENKKERVMPLKARLRFEGFSSGALERYFDA